MKVHSGGGEIESIGGESVGLTGCDKPGKELISWERVGSSEKMVFGDEVASFWTAVSAL